jgi:hypothetical protein
MHIDYIKTPNGKTKSVIIPKREWDAFNSDYMKIKNKLRVLLGLSNALKEVQEIQIGKKKVKTLSEFLDEL